MTSDEQHVQASEPDRPAGGGASANGHRARRPRVAIVFGGRSSEHAVSCATAAGVMRAIDRDKYDIVPIGVSRDGQWVLAADDPARFELTAGRTPEVLPDEAHVVLPLSTRQTALTVLEAGQPPTELGTVDVVLPLLHGPFGEDGTLQGFLELSDIRYVGSGVFASAAGMDKHYMKVVFAGHGLPIGRYAVITDRAWRGDRAAALDACAGLGYPLFVKPARAGSSMGISKVEDPADLEAAIEAARAHDPKVVVEAAVTGREIECAVLEGHGLDGPRTSQVGEVAVHANHAFYDYEAKYLAEADVDLSCPADVPAHVSDEVRRLAAAAFEALGCEGLARVDCFYTDDGRVLVNEINTMPGFTPHSMYPRMWAASGLTYTALIDELVSLALERRTGLR
ncbi:MAG TPA: D-alanine--D-alanine ligase family protein [Intrasporangium sp.]|uniref:D-alanine--D-alanine ligase family protein n=1 Tax=Intrasporangium sp. TaxID=1925024 RepID=UPI002B4A89E9|nr:D-alanine--D-alanine ligase family protein [Intrasporangium sp.]HKX67220.1 D-alanine--D-alanine ligase family protein [Intrasporangium sp.]